MHIRILLLATFMLTARKRHAAKAAANCGVCHCEEKSQFLQNYKRKTNKMPKTASKAAAAAAGYWLHTTKWVAKTCKGLCKVCCWRNATEK